MAECLVIPMVTAAQQPAPAAEPAVTVAGVATDFTLEEIAPPEMEEAPEDADDATEGEVATADAEAPDLLQILIEDLSGISGALRPAPQATTDAGLAEAGLGKAGFEKAGLLPADNAPRIILPVTLDAAPVETAFADGVAIDATFDDAPLAEMASAEIESLLTEGAAPTSSSARTEATSRAEMRSPRITVPVPVPVARQIAEAVVTTRDDVVEIALAPEELGRIRMVMSGPEHNPHVMIWVERPEVLDQLRRNAAFLQECFGDAGMADASFEFAGDTSSESHDDSPAKVPAERSGFEVVEDIRTIPMAWTPMVIPTRLDIRI